MNKNIFHILVVDDDDRIRELVGKYLEDNNFIEVSLLDNHIVLSSVEDQNGGPITVTLTADDLNRRLTVSDSFDIEISLII